MVSVSRETEEETNQRLRRVIAAAELVVHEGPWYFQEYDSANPPLLTDQTLAVVRDADSWSALVPARDELSGPVEQFGIFSFHFPPDADNSGFVGWLATHLKRGLGTGVFVVCGSNSARGGIYDYWGCPIDLMSDAVALVKVLSVR